MARKDRGFGFEGGNIVPFSRGKQGVSSSWVSFPSETNQRTIDSFPIMVIGFQQILKFYGQVDLIVR